MPLRIPPSASPAMNLISQRDIGAGANLKASRFTIPPNQMVLLRNFILIEDGSLMGRRGTLRKNAASLGAGAIQGATRGYYAGNNQHVAVHNGTAYTSTDGVVFTSSLTGWSTTAPMWAWQYLNFLYVATRNDRKKKYDGTTWTDWGIAAPTAAATVAVGAGGTPNGTYTVQYTYITATIESNPSPASGSVTVVNQNINVSGVTVGPAGTTKRKIYGFKTGVSTTYQLIGEINDNVTTTFTITTDQPSWTTAAPTDNLPPSVGPWLNQVFKNRLWLAGDPNNIRRVYFSQVFVPEAFPSSFFVDIPFSFNDEITALYILGDQLLLFGHTEVYYVIGDSPFSFIIRRSYALRGTPGPWAVTRIENTAVYFSRFGLLSFDGAQSRILSDPIEPHFTAIFQNIASVNYAAADKVTVAYYDRLKAVGVSFPTGSSTTNDTTWWYFLRRQGWVEDDRDTRLLLTLDGKGDLGDLYSWDIGNGILRQWDTNFTDDGVAITARFKTGVLAGDHPLATKVFRWLTARARPAAGITLQITAQVDQGAEADTFTITLARGAVYGTGLYGTATYAADFDDFEEAFDAKMRGRGIAYDVAASYTDTYHLAQLYTTYFTMPVVRRRVGV